MLPPGSPVSGEVLTSHVRSIGASARPISHAGKIPAAVVDDVRRELSALIGL